MFPLSRRRFRPLGRQIRRAAQIGWLALWTCIAHHRDRRRFSHRSASALRRRGHRRILHALQAAGPVFVKAGQLLSARPDILSPELAGTLARLHDRVNPFPAREARAILETEWNAPVESVLRVFEERPCAAGSVAQVHKGVLWNGTTVAIKIQRPDLACQLARDLALILWITRWVERREPMLAQQRLSEWVNALSRLFEDECDFKLEAAYQERFAALFDNDPDVRVPRVYPRWSTRRILVMDFLDGIPINRILRLRQAGHALPSIARRGADCTMKQIFTYGLLHCDPHPGNVLVLADGTLGFIDFGQVVRLSSGDRRELHQLLAALVRRDPEQLTRVIRSMSLCDTEPDMRELERDVARLLDQYLYRPLSELHIGLFFADTLHLLTQHRLRVRPCWLPIMKEISTIDQVGKALDPDFDMIAYARPHVQASWLLNGLPSDLAADWLNFFGTLFSRAKTNIQREPT